jgi:hypothetical protein
MRLLPWGRRHADQDARVAHAARCAAEAGQEVERSRVRYDAVHETVVGPLTRRAKQNQFYELIRSGLNEGHRRSS